MGASRGSEAALLLGADVPDLVAGVIALVPSNVARCGYPDCSRPAWTLDGSPVPFTTQRNEPAPTDTPGAIIPVEQIDGPVLAVCGEADEVWDSCAFADAIEARLDEADHPFPHQVIAEPDAGHALGALVPYQPRPRAADPDDIGVSEAGDQAALGRVWPQVLAFLAARAH